MLKLTKVFWIITSRGGAAGFALIASLCITRFFPSDDAGLYFKIIAYSFCYATIISFGANGTALLLSTKKEYSANNISTFIIKELVHRTTISIPFVIISCFFGVLSIDLLLVVFCVGTTFALSQAYQYILIANNRQIEGCFIHGWLPNILIIASSFFKDIEITFFFQVFSYLITSLIQYILIDFYSDKNKNKKIEKISKLLKFNYFQQDILGQVYTSLTLVFASWYLQNENIVILAVLLKITAVCNIFIGSNNTAFYPTAIANYLKCDFFGVRTLWAKSALCNIIFVIFYAFSLFLLWGYIQQLFKLRLDYRDVFILNIGYLFAGGCAFSQLLLNSAGKSGEVKNIIWLSFIIGVSLINILCYSIGYQGIVYAIAFTLSFQSTIIIRMCGLLVRGK